MGYETRAGKRAGRERERKSREHPQSFGKTIYNCLYFNFGASILGVICME